MVDTLVSGTNDRRVVQVRVLSWVQNKGESHRGSPFVLLTLSYFESFLSSFSLFIFTGTVPVMSL